MSSRLPALIAALVVLGTLFAVPMAGLAAQADTPTDAPPENETATAAANESTPPGAQLAGVVGVGEAEIEADVDERAFGIRVAQAASNGSRADVVSDRLADVEARLTDLEDERDELEQARENGSMSEGEYRARVARLAAESQGAENAANRTAEVAAGLPVDLLESKGINVAAIQTLADRADELAGPEIAEIARSIAGPNVGESAAGDRAPFGEDGPVPEDVSPGDAGPDDRGGADDGNVTQSPDGADAPEGAGDDGDTRDDGTQSDGA